MLDEEKSLPILKAAYGRGLDTRDTSSSLDSPYHAHGRTAGLCVPPANMYSNSSSEAITSKVLRTYNMPHNKVVILTKFWGNVGKKTSRALRRGWTKFVNMQNHFSLLYREEERDVTRNDIVTLLAWGSSHGARCVVVRSPARRGRH